MEKIPVFIINGFLEAGKTQFIKFTMEQEYFYTEGLSLLIVTEEGEEEYSSEFLESKNTVAIYLDKLEDINKLDKLIAEYKPERIILEWNGLWLQDKLELPDTCFVNQIVTIFDTSTLDLYFKNMKAYIGPMLENTELIICNRADDIEEEKLAKYHMNFRAMSKDSEIIFEGEKGEIRGDFSIELPYDLDADLIKIKNEDYGIFYIDSMDRKEKYIGKNFEYIGQVLKNPKNPFANYFVTVRTIMTCCIDDLRHFGYPCEYAGAVNFKNKEWVKVRGKLSFKYNEAYEGEGLVLVADEVVHTGPVEEIIEL